ncbi:MAG: septum formation initiator family protein [Ignavibacteriaceae bacterium]|jgi:cell division protein FtsB|nr:septum formation initiator family protein [Ignavibacteriaceae bacterium]
MKLRFSNQKILLVIFFTIALAGFSYLAFNETGIVKYIKVKSELDSLKAVVKSLEVENKIISAENDSLLKKVPAKIERIAREKYSMGKKNEIVIKIEKQ